jgi:hypothetical protein
MSTEITALSDAAARLKQKGLLQTGDSLSVRILGEAACWRWVQGRGEREKLAFGDEDRHRSLYLDRPDLGAILIASPPWSGALGHLSAEMPGLFDEQVRHLGRKVVRLSPDALKSGDNAFLLGDSVLCLGMTLDRLVFNAELFEKCAKAFVLAHSSGIKPTRVPWWVRMIAGRRLLKDERFAAECYAEGRKPVFKSAY